MWSYCHRSIRIRRHQTGLPIKSLARIGRDPSARDLELDVLELLGVIAGFGGGSDEGKTRLFRIEHLDLLKSMTGLTFTDPTK